MKTLMEQMAEIQQLADELPHGVRCECCGQFASEEVSITIRGNGTERSELCDPCYEYAINKLNGTIA